MLNSEQISTGDYVVFEETIVVESVINKCGKTYLKGRTNTNTPIFAQVIYESGVACALQLIERKDYCIIEKK